MRDLIYEYMSEKEIEDLKEYVLEDEQNRKQELNSN